MRHDLIGKELQIVGLGESVERKLHQLKAELMQLRQAVPQFGRVTSEGRHLAVEPRSGPRTGGCTVPIEKDGQRGRLADRGWIAPERLAVLSQDGELLSLYL